MLSQRQWCTDERSFRTKQTSLERKKNRGKGSWNLIPSFSLLVLFVFLVPESLSCSLSHLLIHVVLGECADRTMCWLSLTVMGCNHQRTGKKAALFFLQDQHHKHQQTHHVQHSIHMTPIGHQLQRTCIGSHPQAMHAALLSQTSTLVQLLHHHQVLQQTTALLVISQLSLLSLSMHLRLGAVLSALSSSPSSMGSTIVYQRW